ncbi:CBS domain-containing protein, partial [Neptunomonas phycophila]|uniref:CBS domain-containing protein n=1 Tax=Neptunomonas phycophila TaxID=1572645 RepID=UPI001C37BEBA
MNVVWSDAEKGLFVETVADVAQRHPAIVDSKMSIKEVAHIMRYQHHSSCAVIIENQQIIGIITDRDMTKRVIADGVSTDSPITQV